jgi:hypothetical protein
LFKHFRHARRKFILSNKAVVIGIQAVKKDFRMWPGRLGLRRPRRPGWIFSQQILGKKNDY